MKKTIKQEVKSFALKLRKELINRDKVVNQKSNEWYESKSGELHAATTEHLQNLWESVSTTLDELDIKIPYLK